MNMNFQLFFQWELQPVKFLHFQLYKYKTVHKLFDVHLKTCNFYL